MIHQTYILLILNLKILKIDNSKINNLDFKKDLFNMFNEYLYYKKQLDNLLDNKIVDEKIKNFFNDKINDIKTK